jgi:hypothetical protein
MYKKLFIPGPTDVDPSVLEKMATPMIGHRTAEATELQKSISEKLQKLMYTDDTILLSTSSGTGLMEGSIRSCTRKRAAVFSVGAFGNRWHQLATANNVPADIFKSEPGQPTTPEMVDEVLKTGKYDVVTVTHNETSSGSELHLLDTPGILPPKLADEDEAFGLAATGAIRDTILPLEEVARKLLVRLRRDYNDETAARYGEVDGDVASDFDSCAVRMGCILSEGVPDTARFSSMLLDDFRAGRIGRISLEWPPPSPDPPDPLESFDDTEGMCNQTVTP